VERVEALTIGRAAPDQHIGLGQYRVSRPLRKPEAVIWLCPGCGVTGILEMADVSPSGAVMPGQGCDSPGCPNAGRPAVLAEWGGR
jgi:hypothetical protein